MEKQEKKEKKILTENRLMTVNKRETSFEGLSDRLENGEDGIYNLIQDNDKNVIFKPKISITRKDLEEMPLLAQQREAIDTWDKVMRESSGKDAFTIKKALIEMRKDQYLIKQSYKPPVIFNKITHSQKPPIYFKDKSEFIEGELRVRGVSLLDPKCCSAILCNYSRLKEDSVDNFEGDTWYLLKAFEEITDKALEEYPLYQKLIIYKIDGLTNQDIQEKLFEEFQIRHSLEYISSLWRNKIPKLIANEAQAQFITFEAEKQKLPFKRCSKCGRRKPSHHLFFTKNSHSKDGFYSICKNCRNNRKVR